MSKRQRRAFGDESSGSSDEDEDGLQEYMRKKASKFQEKTEQSFDLDDDVHKSSEQDEQSKKPQKSNFIGNILASKKQRELDRLYSQSLKNKLVGESQNPGANAEEVYITEAYQGKKKQIEEAESLAAVEQERESADMNLNAFRFNARILYDDKRGESANTSNTTMKQIDTRQKVFGNDIYRPPNSTLMPLKSKDSANPISYEVKVELVKSFLKSNVSKADLELLKKNTGSGLELQAKILGKVDMIQF